MKTVFVVDYEPIVREVAVRYLEHQGYRTLESAEASRPRRGCVISLLLPAIARGLVEAHSGRIWAQEREGRGARVCFTLEAS